MTPPAPTTRRTRAVDWLWLVACALVVHAVLDRYLPDAELPTRLLIAAICGALLATSPVRLGGRGARLKEAGLGAAGLAGLVLLLVAIGAYPLGESFRPEFRWWPAWIAVIAHVAVGLYYGLHRLWRLVRVEWLKMWRSRLFLIGLLATGSVTLLAGFGHNTLPADTGWSVASASLGIGLMPAEVFLLVLGAIALAGESTGGTMKMLLPHAYRRSDWVLAKTIVLLGVAVLFFAVVAAVALGHAAATEGLGDVTMELEPVWGETTGERRVVQESGVMWGHMGEALVVSLAALCATALLGLFVSALFDGVVAALCVAFLLFAGIEFADVVFLLSRETLQGIYAWYPSELRDLTGKLGSAFSARWDAALFAEGLRLALLTGLTALLLSIRVFSKRDLHV